MDAKGWLWLNFGEESIYKWNFDHSPPPAPTLFKSQLVLHTFSFLQGNEDNNLMNWNLLSFFFCVALKKKTKHKNWPFSFWTGFHDFQWPQNKVLCEVAVSILNPKLWRRIWFIYSRIWVLITKTEVKSLLYVFMHIYIYIYILCVSVDTHQSLYTCLLRIEIKSHFVACLPHPFHPYLF